MLDVSKAPPGWYCLKALPKREHIAAQVIRSEIGIETLCPLVRFQKPTRRGKVWFQEPLFPGYVFANCDLGEVWRRLCATSGIRGIVHYGAHVPRVPESLIVELRQRLGEGDRLVSIEPPLTPGTAVRITEGPFRSWDAVVSGTIPSRERVQLLLDFLGRQLSVEVAVDKVVVQGHNPLASLTRG